MLKDNYLNKPCYSGVFNKHFIANVMLIASVKNRDRSIYMTTL